MFAVSVQKKQTRAISLRVNSSETKMMLSALAPDVVAPIDLDGVALETADSFNYPGSFITDTG